MAHSSFTLTFQLGSTPDLKHFADIILRSRRFRSTKKSDTEAMGDYAQFSDITQECPESCAPDGSWPPINVRAACDILLQRLDDLPPISHSALGQNLGYANIDHKIFYLERKSYLQSSRGICASWLTAIQSDTAVPNELSITCQRVLDIIDGHLQSLDLWLQTLPEYDRQELSGVTQLHQETYGWFERLSKSEQDKWLEYLRQRYQQHRADMIDPKMVEELADDIDHADLIRHASVLVGAWQHNAGHVI